MTLAERTPLQHLEETVPLRFQALYRRAISGGRTAAVKAMCLECQGWEDGAVQGVRDCASIACPLHAVRPYQSKEDREEGEEIGSVDGVREVAGTEGDTAAVSGVVDERSAEDVLEDLMREDRKKELQAKRIEALRKARAARGRG